MSDTIRLAIAGLGTVGAGSIALLKEHAAMLEARSGKKLEVVAVSARNKSKARDCDWGAAEWVDAPEALGERADVDIVVELMGGSEGTARTLVENALANGKHVVTANKALIAHHGVALAKRAEEKGVVLAFEAAVAGGIPIIDALRNGLSANRFTRVAGILNGTCNYILTTMQKQGRDFDDVLSEAQALGYAEADPSFDVDGMDTAHKLAILTSLAYGVPVNIDAVSVDGIRRVTRRDMQYTRELGYAIKLLGITEMTNAGILQRVHACLVPLAAPIAVIDGAFNAVHIEGDAVGRVLLEGRGAGAGPTASSVVADILQIARGARYHPFNISASAMKPMANAEMADLVRSYYLRLTVRDEPGVLANITAIFAEQSISVQSLIQHSHTADTPAEVVITTHDTKESAMQNALQRIAALASVVELPYMIRIEKL